MHIVKIGGNVIDSPEATRRFLTQFAALPVPKILVHGGGKLATQIAERLGLKAQLVDGRRITDEAMLEVVTMVYGGLVNKRIVAQLQAMDCNAIGLTGADANVILAKKREVKEIDYGFAGDIVAVNAEQFIRFLHQNLVPVIAPLTYARTGSLLNTNADTMASAVASALASAFDVQLVYCFEKKGVLANPSDDDSVIPQLTHTEYVRLKAEGVISKGMIPKLDNAYAALQQGVRRVIICHADELTQATQPDSLTAGTVLVR